MSAEYELIADEVFLVIDLWKVTAKDGTVSVVEGTAILTRMIGEFVRLAEPLFQLTGPQKRSLVIEAAQHAYDQVLAPLDIPGIPDFLENSIVDPMIGTLIAPIVGGLIDGVVALFNDVGVFKHAH